MGEKGGKENEQKPGSSLLKEQNLVSHPKGLKSYEGSWPVYRYPLDETKAAADGEAVLWDL